jgi:sec-independent protein translocase protein TatA
MFDPSAPHIIILLVVVLLLFGSTRLPGAAEALGKSMRIFKSEAKKLHDDDKPADGVQVVAQQPAVPPQQLPAQAPVLDPTQQQLADLQRQVQELQRRSADGSGTSADDKPLSDVQSNQQPFTS